jgi:hypothetical protein
MDLLFDQDHQEWATLAQGQPGAPVALVVFTDRFIWHSLGDFGNPMFARRPHFCQAKAHCSRRRRQCHSNFNNALLAQRYSACYAKHADPAFIADAAT